MMRTSLLIAVLILACGCASQPKPPTPEVESAIRSRLSDYSAAWFAGDASGVERSFVARNEDEAEFGQSLGRLATAQRALLKEQSAVPPAIAATVQMSETQPMVMLNRPWHHYAYASGRTPQSMVHESKESPDVVMVRMIKNGELTMRMRNVDGRWLIDPSGWVVDRPVGALTDSIRRQVVLTTNATNTIRAKDWEGLRSVLQQLNQQRMVDRISDSSSMQSP